MRSDNRNGAAALDVAFPSRSSGIRIIIVDTRRTPVTILDRIRQTGRMIAVNKAESVCPEDCLFATWVADHVISIKACSGHTQKATYEVYFKCFKLALPPWW